MSVQGARNINQATRQPRVCSRRIPPRSTIHTNHHALDHPSIHPLQRSPVHDSLNQQQQTPTTNRTSRSRTPEPACIAAGVCHPRHAYHAVQLIAATRPSAPFRAVPPSHVLCSHHAHSRHEDGTCGRGHFLSSAFLLWESLCRHCALLRPPCGSHWISSNP
ncbi:hypothetical protein LCI18_000857 [Fusarium solani-melongenae]|uniref:Uncharacterized protein n=1 Tax=Fusarium solani subsp. cucurbitae TaxID=2747967 RepID=A0ACD3YLR0_FUSSC|nr:hypothetical protein LCI18_000857 [Fusarium solani-melongenae]